VSDIADSAFWQEKPFRFSKFYLQTLFDGQLHLVRRGADFPEHWSQDELSRKLRNAAWWRGTTIRLSFCPQGVWVQSGQAVDDGLSLNHADRERLAALADENARLKEEVMELRREVWKLKNP
jgi:hypothetical protein